MTGAGIVAAGAPARGAVVAGADGVISEVPHTIDPATFPEITVETDVTDWNHEIAGAGAQEVLLTLAENLELENQALLRSDDEILTAVDHGDRLDEMRDRLRDAQASGSTVVSHYLFDAVNVDLIVPFGVQTGLSLGLESQGTVTTETYDEAGVLQDRESAPFDLTFVHAPRDRRPMAQRGRPAGQRRGLSRQSGRRVGLASRPDPERDDEPGDQRGAVRGAPDTHGADDRDLDVGEVDLEHDPDHRQAVVRAQEREPTRPDPADREDHQRQRQPDAEDRDRNAADAGVRREGDRLAAVQRAAVRQRALQLDRAQVGRDDETDGVERDEDEPRAQPGVGPRSADQLSRPQHRRSRRQCLRGSLPPGFARR